jgi:hypothetical protein
MAPPALGGKSLTTKGTKYTKGVKGDHFDEHFSFVTFVSFVVENSFPVKNGRPER